MARSAKHIIESYVVSSARLGSQAARAQLVTRYQPRFLRHAYRLLGDAEQAEDAVQDAWLEIVRGLSNLKDDLAFQAWAFRIVTRRCARIITKQKNMRGLINRTESEPAPNGEATDQLELAAEQGPLREALAALSPEHRVAVALFYLEEMSVAEVAVVLDIPVGTVKSRLMNARAKLRESLDRRNDGQTR